MDVRHSKPGELPPIVLSRWERVNGHDVERVPWEVSTSGAAAALGRFAHACLATDSLFTSAYVHGFGAHPIGRGVSCFWLVWIPRGQEVTFDTIARHEDRRHPTTVSIPNYRGCEVGDVLPASSISCECGAQAVTVHYPPSEINDAEAQAASAAQWADELARFRARHTPEGRRTELQARQEAREAGHIRDEDAWLIYTTDEEGHGGCLLWWKPKAAGYTRHIEEAGRYSELDARRQAGHDSAGGTGNYAVRYLDAVKVALRVVRIGSLPKPPGARW